MNSLTLMLQFGTLDISSWGLFESSLMAQFIIARVYSECACIYLHITCGQWLIKSLQFPYHYVQTFEKVWISLDKPFGGWCTTDKEQWGLATGYAVLRRVPLYQPEEYGWHLNHSNPFLKVWKKKKWIFFILHC